MRFSFPVPLLIVSGICLLGATGCKTTRDFTSRSRLYARADYPWELEFESSLDITNLVHVTDGDASAVIRIRHPKINDGKTIVLYVEDPSGPCKEIHRSDSDGELLKIENTYGWGGNILDYSIHGFLCDNFFLWNLGATLLGKYPPEDWRVSLDITSVDFPKWEYCRWYISNGEKNYGVLDETGVSIYVDCGEWRPYQLGIYVRIVTINGKRVPSELLRPYMSGQMTWH